MLATMLLFRFDNHSDVGWVDLTLAFLPLVFLDWSIVSLVVGLLLWYGDKNNLWRTTVVSAHTAAMLVITLGVAIWMYLTMSRSGGLGEFERSPSTTAPNHVSQRETQ
jgi:ABC-type tungstate transport system substrate-binding protein